MKNAEKLKRMSIDFEEEKKKAEENDHDLCMQKVALDSSLLELQLATSWLFGEALDTPETLNELKKITREITKLAHAVACPLQITDALSKRNRKTVF